MGPIEHRGSMFLDRLGYTSCPHSQSNLAGRVRVEKAIPSLLQNRVSILPRPCPQLPVLVLLSIYAVPTFFQLNVPLRNLFSPAMRRVDWCSWQMHTWIYRRHVITAGAAAFVTSSAHAVQAVVFPGLSTRLTLVDTTVYLASKTFSNEFVRRYFSLFMKLLCSPSWRTLFGHTLYQLLHTHVSFDHFCYA